MERKRVVITGMGVVSPIAIGTSKEYEAALRAGTNGVSVIEKFSTDKIRAKVAGKVRGFDPDYFGIKSKRHDTYEQYGIAAADLAVKDASLELTEESKRTTGVYGGTGIGGLETLLTQHSQLICTDPDVKRKGQRFTSGMLVPMITPNMVAGNVAIRNGLLGPNYNISSACASFLHAFGEAFLAISESRSVAYDINSIDDYKLDSLKSMFVVGAEAVLEELSVAGFSNMRALSANPDPNKASRPFDSERDGFVLGEGASCIILEELDHARSRGAKIYCEVIGYGSSADASHITAPNEYGPMRAVTAAVNMARTCYGFAPSEINHVNAHGTSTPFNDANELLVYKKLFGDQLSKMYWTAIKSMTGHLLGATGGTEIAAAALSCYKGFVPPIINTTEILNKDGDGKTLEVKTNFVLGQPKDLEITGVLKQNFGFGGQNAAVVLRPYDGR